MKQFESKILVFRNLSGYYKIVTKNVSPYYIIDTGDVSIMTRKDLLKIILALLKLFVFGKRTEITT